MLGREGPGHVGWTGLLAERRRAGTPSGRVAGQTGWPSGLSLTREREDCGGWSQLRVGCLGGEGGGAPAFQSGCRGQQGTLKING